MGSFKLVHGVGVNDWHSKVRVNGKMIPEYQLWANMLYRGVKAAKEKHIKLIAEKYKDLIDCKVYQALLSWEITIKD